MERDEFIDILTGVLALARAEVRRAVERIIALAYPYAEFVEGEFRFEDFPDLNEEVNAVLRGLSDRGMEILKARIENALALIDGTYEEYEDIIEDVENEGDGVLWAFDLHSSNLKKLLEGWLTIGFAQALSQGELLARINGYMDAPQDAPLWRDAVRARLIDPNEYHFGRGYQRNIPNAMKVLIIYIVTKVFMLGQQRSERAKGATFYIRHRGSRYDCPECDSYCEIPFPIEEPIVVPHPNCVCWTEYFYVPLPTE